MISPIFGIENGANTGDSLKVVVHAFERDDLWIAAEEDERIVSVARGGGFHLRQSSHSLQGGVIGGKRLALRSHNLHFRVEGGVEAANQIVETVEDRKGAEKGCRAEGDSDHGNGGDEIDGTDSLAGKQIATRHKEGESTVSHKNPKVYSSIGAAGLFSEEPPSARSASMWSR